MKSRASIANHPLHPMLIVVPAGAFITVLILDIVYLATGVELWWNAAKPVMLIGIVGALIAAIPGTIDLFTIGRRKEVMNTGLTHMVLNLLVVGVFILNLLARWPGSAPEVEGVATWPAGFWASLAGVVLLAVAGWLGWQMVYEHKMGVVEEADLRERHQRERREHHMPPDQPAEPLAP